MKKPCKDCNYCGQRGVVPGGIFGGDKLCPKCEGPLWLKKSRKSK